ncbi:MAG TPA: outer membrane lipid asymmetry maintenance protein MlaD [Rhizobiales bacterium]|nr:outer membrane lipid asymmetry maintenance protein MlaD [Hyphomicrobiales bacterium]
MKNNMVETAVGALVIAIAVAFFLFVRSSTDLAHGGNGYRILAEFENIEGISVGSDIRMAGIKIGSVVAQKLDPKTYQAVVTMDLADYVKLPDDTTAKVTSEGLLGSKFITLEVGGSDTILKDGDKLTYTQSALDIWALINEFMFSDKKKK